MGRTVLIAGYSLAAVMIAGAQAAAQHYPPGYGAPFSLASSSRNASADLVGSAVALFGMICFSG